MKKINIKIDGMHCSSCKTLIESDVKDLSGVKNISVDHITGKCNIEFDENNISDKEIFKTIERLNYSVVNNLNVKKNKGKSVKNFFIAIALIVFFLIIYALVKNFGLFEILSRLNDKELGYGLIFVIGLLTSFHCVGMCGGVVTAYTAYGKGRDAGQNNLFPHFQYNLGRLISYSFTGAVLGGIGSVFVVSPVFGGVVLLIASMFMILMGLSLLTNFSWFKKIKINTPSFVARLIYNNKNTEKPKAPFVIGLLTGFMPCGPLQAMQLYALSSGDIVHGFLSMFIYSLGTVPLMFGFGSIISLLSGQIVKRALKVSGIIVIVLGVFMLNRALTSFGYNIHSIIYPQKIEKSDSVIVNDNNGYQVINMDISGHSYSPNTFFVQKGVPVRWVIDVKDDVVHTLADQIILHGFYKKQLQRGVNILEFNPSEVGEIKFSCWREVIWGKFIVK